MSIISQSHHLLLRNGSLKGKEKNELEKDSKVENVPERVHCVCIQGKAERGTVKRGKLGGGREGQIRGGEMARVGGLLHALQEVPAISRLECDL